VSLKKIRHQKHGTVDDGAAGDGAVLAGPGLQLEKCRRYRGFGIEVVAEQLNLSPGVVRALEADDYASLPSPTFVRGYLKNYARLLEVSDKELLKAFDQVAQVCEDEGEDIFSSFTRPGQIHLKSAIVALLVMAVGGGFAWWWHNYSFQHADFTDLMSNAVEMFGESGGPDADVVVQRLGVEVEASDTERSDPASSGLFGSVTPVLEKRVGTLPDPSTLKRDMSMDGRPSGTGTGIPAGSGSLAAGQPAPLLKKKLTIDNGGGRNVDDNALDTEFGLQNPELTGEARLATNLSMAFDGDCWVEVRDWQGDTLYSDLKRDGSQLKLQGKPPLDVLLGNGRVVTLSYNGEPVAINYSRSSGVARFKLGY